MELTLENIDARRIHLREQLTNTQKQIAQLQGQFQAIDGALQDVAYWENEVKNAIDAEQRKQALAEYERQQLAQKLDVAVAHQEGLNDGIESGSRKAGTGRKASKRG
jgi:chromosome segregation ATPase